MLPRMIFHTTKSRFLKLRSKEKVRYKNQAPTMLTCNKIRVYKLWVPITYFLSKTNAKGGLYGTQTNTLCRKHLNKNKHVIKLRMLNQCKVLERITFVSGLPIGCDITSASREQWMRCWLNSLFRALVSHLRCPKSIVTYLLCVLAGRITFMASGINITVPSPSVFHTCPNCKHWVKTVDFLRTPCQ